MTEQPPQTPYADWSADDLSKLHWGKLAREEQDFYLRPVLERATAHERRWSTISVEERFRGFNLIGFHPHGHYLPDDDRARQILRLELERLGLISDVDERLRRYHEFQDLTARVEQSGIKGSWTGQLAVAKSEAQFRIVAWGRRGGKTVYAANEALAVCMVRPRARVWIAAAIMKLVSRSFDEYVIPLIEDLGIKTRTMRSSNAEKIIVFENGSAIEGVSLENVLSVAGATVDFAIIDEAAQIVPDAWYRGILPPLASRNGQALLISSFEGEGDFFSEQVTKVEAQLAEYRSRITDIMEEAPKVEWAMFQAPSYEVNFYDFPQGRRSPTIQLQERNMPPEEFQEQFGARPLGARERVYREFNEKIHTAEFDPWWDTSLPVYLVADPSSGINEYAVAAIQDHHPEGNPYLHVIDEFYRTGMTAEAIAPILRARPWIGNVTEMIVDDPGGNDETIRWRGLQFPAVPVFEKPEVYVRLPLVRNFLRDPVRYYTFYREKVNQVLVSRGFGEDDDLDMLTAEANKIYGEVLELLSPAALSPEDIKRLVACSRLFVSKTCFNTITEFKMYSHEKKRRQNVEYKERPRKFKDHLMDCVGYYCWNHYRHELNAPTRLPRTYLGPSGVSFDIADVMPHRPERPEDLVRVRTPGEGFLGYMRDVHSAPGHRGVSLMRVA